MRRPPQREAAIGAEQEATAGAAANATGAEATTGAAITGAAETGPEQPQPGAGANPPSMIMPEEGNALIAGAPIT